MESNLLLNIAINHTNSNISDDQLGAILSIENGAPIIQSVPDNEYLGNPGAFSNVLDSTGKALEFGQNYEFRGKKVKVLSEQFGCGNILDNYYRVHYLNSDLEKGCTVVEVRYIKSLQTRLYQSEFQPIPKASQ
jgi:hypothetical protein